MILRGQTDGMRLRRCGSRVGEFWILNFGFLIEEEIAHVPQSRDAEAPWTRSVEWSNRRIRDDAPYRWTTLKFQRPE